MKGCPPPPAASASLLERFWTLGNPKAVVFFSHVLPHAFDLKTVTQFRAVAILGMGVAVDLTVQSIYLAAAMQARAFIRSPRSMKLINRSSAGMMAGSTALIASQGKIPGQTCAGFGEK